MGTNIKVWPCIHVKAILALVVQYINFLLLFTVESVAESLSVTIQIKATEQFFPVVLFVMLYKVVLTFEPVDEILSLNVDFSQYYIIINVETNARFYPSDNFMLRSIIFFPFPPFMHVTDKKGVSAWCMQGSFAMQIFTNNV